MFGSKIKEVPRKEVTLRRSNNFSPVMSGRPTVISRSSVGDSYPSYTSNRQSLSLSGHFERTGDVSDVKENREREKKDLRNLNERLASYIEKVRFLEAQNKALLGENDKLKKNVLFEPSKIRQMYDVELQQARKIIDSLTRQKSEMEVKVVSLEDVVKLEKQEREAECSLTHDYKMRFDRLYDLCGRMECDMFCLKERNAALNGDIGAAREEIKRLQDDNNRLRMDLDNETTSHINVNNRCQSLEEDMAFATSVYEQEIRELQAMTQKDSNLEMRDYWHGELTGAIKEIQTEYDTRLDQIKADLETRMNMQMRNIKTTQAPTYDMAPVKEESKRLRERVLDLSNRINELENKNGQLQKNLRDRTMHFEEREHEIESERMRMGEDMLKMQNELEAVLVEMQILMDCKLTMEMEIAAYRKLLENEETRISTKHSVPSVQSASNMQSTLNDQSAAWAYGLSIAQGVPSVQSASSAQSASWAHGSSSEQGVSYKASVSNAQSASWAHGSSSEHGVSNKQSVSNAQNASWAHDSFSEQGVSNKQSVSNAQSALWAHGSSSAEDASHAKSASWKHGASSVPAIDVTDKFAMIEQTGRTTVQKMSCGPMSFQEAAPDGRYVIIQNTTSGHNAKTIDLKGWKIHKVLANGSVVDYVFAKRLLSPDQSLKIWCKGAASQMGFGDLSGDFFSWGNGSSTTYLQDPSGKEKASIVQKFTM